MEKQSHFTERELAKIYAHYVYRNTVIEDFHAEGKCLDETLYNKMYSVVYRKVKNIQSYKKYLYLLDKNISFHEEIDQVPDEIVFKVMRFLRDIAFNICAASNRNGNYKLSDKKLLITKLNIMNAWEIGVEDFLSACILPYDQIIIPAEKRGSAPVEAVLKKLRATK